MGRRAVRYGHGISPISPNTPPTKLAAGNPPPAETVRARVVPTKVRVVDPIAQLRPAPISDDPAHSTSRAASVIRTGQPGPRHLTLASTLGVHTRTTPPPKGMRDARMGPWTQDPRTSVLLAHGPAPGPRFRTSTRAAPQRLTAPPHHSAPRAAQHQSALRHRSALLCTAHLSARHRSCTAMCTSLHRCTSLHLSACSLQLPALGVEPTVQSAGSTHSPNRQVTSFGMECLPERPFSVPLRRQGAAAAQQGGGQACQLDRT